MPIQEWLNRLFSIERPAAPPAIPPGLYHARQDSAGQFARFHLRVEHDGSGLLITNAAAMARLTATGVIIAKGLLESQDQSAILRELSKHFHGATEAAMQADIAQFQTLLDALANPQDAYPMFNLEPSALLAHAAALIAPLQAAVSLAAPEQLRAILDRLWAAGIPHVTLLTDANTPREALLHAVEHAEDLGMITGVRARASELLQDESLLPDLAVAGLDHITLPYAAADPAIHDALYGAGDHAAAGRVYAWLEENGICAVAETPLTPLTLKTLDDTVTALLAMGADNLTFFAVATATPLPDALPANALPQAAAQVEDIATEAQARFLWLPPVERDPARTLAEQLGEGRHCAGDLGILVAAHGAVIPPRGPHHSAGNLLTEAWRAIWEHPTFRAYREQLQAPAHCELCPGLTVCAAGCPRERAGWVQTAT